MAEKLVMVVVHPRERVWDALCERTCDLVPWLDHIESAEQVSREALTGERVRSVHVWRARAQLPALLANHVNEDWLVWTVRNEWQADQYETQWRVEPRSLKDDALCEGRMRLSPAIGGKGTRIEIELELLALKQSTAMRTMARSLIEKHFRQLADATTRQLNDA